MPLSPSETRALLQQLGHHPRKQLGQNFLIDGNIVRKSLDYANIQTGDSVVEIGPGLGTLSQSLLQAGAQLYAVEKDPTLHQYLAQHLQALHPQQFSLLHGDAMEHPRALLPNSISHYKIVANLPYAISTPWMETVLHGTLPQSLVLMLQKEAADRFAASHGGKHFGAVTIFLQSAFHLQNHHKVAKHCFYPIPKVDSSLVHLQIKDKPFLFDPEARLLIRNIFTQRRKQIGSLCKNNPRLETWQQYLQQNNIPNTTRAEDIPLEHWHPL